MLYFLLPIPGPFTRPVQELPWQALETSRAAWVYISKEAEYTLEQLNMVKKDRNKMIVAWLRMHPQFMSNTIQSNNQKILWVGRS